MSVFSIQLEARDPARNRFRAYQLDVARDLFGAWLVEVKFGRIGAKGRKLVAVLDDEHAARRMVCERLKRREGAPKRIGVAYRTLGLWDPHAWMPATRSDAERGSLS
jgi:predicted DNA-binding WGR domain protein